MHPKILVSACLLGKPVRYNGSAMQVAHPALERWRREGRIVEVCPEVLAGFSVPRPPAEIADGASGDDVLSGAARVVEIGGRDVTEFFLASAQATLEIAKANRCAYALLIDGSPSCGSSFIHDGRFQGKVHAGTGITAALLARHDIAVFAHTQIDELEAAMTKGAEASKQG